MWLLLVGQLGKLREPAPAGLAGHDHAPGMPAGGDGGQQVRAGRDRLDDAAQFVDDTVIDEEILMAERNAALRTAFAELPPRCQQLIGMLASDPPHSYAEISAALRIPVGSIGPQRGRCLERMRRSQADPRRDRNDWAGGGQHA